MEKQYGLRTIKYMYYVEQLSPNHVCKIVLEYSVLSRNLPSEVTDNFTISCTVYSAIIIPEMFVGFGSKVITIWEEVFFFSI